MFGREVDLAIMAHAMVEHPRECCGAVTADGYLRLENVSPEPERAFDCDEQVADLMARGVAILGLAHSHPAIVTPAAGFERTRTAEVTSDLRGPSAADMHQQIAMDIPWGIVVTDGKDCLPVMWWGPGVPTPPLEGRDWRHGPSGSDGRGDCFALLRDYYATAHGVTIPEFPRDDAYWLFGQDLITDHIAAVGFMPTDDPRPGDACMMKVDAPVPNHVGVLLPGGLLLHHPGGRISRTHSAVAVMRKNNSIRWYRHARLCG